MTIRTAVAAIALIAAGATTPTFAEDGDLRRAEILLEEARAFGKPDPRGKAAGEIAAEREQRRNAKETLSVSEQRWERALEQASYGN